MSAPSLPPDIALMRPPDLLRALLSDPDAGRRRHVVTALRFLRARMSPQARRRALRGTTGQTEPKTEMTTWAANG